MGNYKFKISDMIPNAWFYKLTDMTRTRNHTTSSHQPVKKKLQPPPPPPTKIHNLSQPRQYSCYYNTSSTLASKEDKFHINSPTNPKASDTQFPDQPPRKSPKKRTKRKTIYNPSPRLATSASAGCSCRPTPNSGQNYFSSSDESSPEADDVFSSSSCRVTSSTTDIIIDMNKKSYSSKFEGFGHTISEVQLPPILTKPGNFKEARDSSKFEGIEADHGSLSIKIVKDGTSKSTQKESKTNNKSASCSRGVKLQVNSPRIGSKRVQACGRRKPKSQQRRSFSESFAIVKSSFDPQKDFKDSMVEMIVENDIRASKDLEELLACYLSLNSDEYHDLIVKAFEQIWLSMAGLRM